MLARLFDGALQALALVTPISIAGTSLVFFPLAGIWLLGARWTWRERPPIWGLAEKAFLVYLLISSISAVGGLRPAHSFHKIEKDLYFGIVILLVALVRTEDQAKQLLKLFVIGGVLTGILGLLQAASGLRLTALHSGQFITKPAFFNGWPAGILDYLSLVGERAIGTRSHPLTYAEGLLFVLAAILSHLANPQGQRFWTWIICAAAVGGGLVVSQSRGPWLAALLMTCIIVAMRPSKALLTKLMILALPALALLASPALQQRIGSIFDQRHKSNAERLHMWTTGRILWSEHPWFGIGPGTVRIAAEPYELPEEKADGGWGHLHSLYINLLAERGALGLIAYLLLIGAIMAELWRALRRADPKSLSWNLYAAAILGVVGFLVSGITETVYNDTIVLMVLYFMTGLALSQARRPRSAQA